MEKRSILRVKTQGESLKESYHMNNRNKRQRRGAFVDLSLTSFAQSVQQLNTQVIDFETPQPSSTRSSATTSIGTVEEDSPSSSSPLFRSLSSTFQNGNNAVKFDKICIRQYNRTISDNPSCSSGLPIGLDWDYDPDQLEIPIDTFEAFRKGSRRLNKVDLRMPYLERYNLLKYEFNVPADDIRKVISELKLSKIEQIKETLLSMEVKENEDNNNDDDDKKYQDQDEYHEYNDETNKDEKRIRRNSLEELPNKVSKVINFS